MRSEGGKEGKLEFVILKLEDSLNTDFKNSLQKLGSYCLREIIATVPHTTDINHDIRRKNLLKVFLK